MLKNNKYYEHILRYEETKQLILLNKSEIYIGGRSVPIEINEDKKLIIANVHWADYLLAREKDPSK